MAFWQGAGVRLAGDEWGDPEAPPVPLLHGAGQTRHSWRTTGSALAAEGWHVIALDLRGHGDSERSPAGGATGGPVPALVLVDISVEVEQEGSNRVRGFMTAHPTGSVHWRRPADHGRRPKRCARSSRTRPTSTWPTPAT